MSAMRVNRRAFERTASRIDRGKGPLTVQDLHDIFTAELVQPILTTGAAPAHCRRCGIALPASKPIQLAGGYTAEFCHDCHNAWLELAQGDPRSIAFIRLQREIQSYSQPKDVPEKLDIELMRAIGRMFKMGRDFAENRRDPRPTPPPEGKG
jgi:hypothetical protein